MNNLQGAATANSINPSGHELYNEQHESVAVMFASIPYFDKFCNESHNSKTISSYVALLNEIICDFDKLLLKNKFSGIEKIKTIGSTYMAAAGLRPGSGSLVSARDSNASQLNQQRQQHTCHSIMAFGHSNLGPDLQGERRLMPSQINLTCMIQFATSLMSVLNRISKRSPQNFKLRVGVNTGPVVAGIIGVQRPFYDIWGDCVNVSRFFSLIDSLNFVTTLSSTRHP